MTTPEIDAAKDDSAAAEADVSRLGGRIRSEVADRDHILAGC
jgi:hypothetical protein